MSRLQDTDFAPSALVVEETHSSVINTTNTCTGTDRELFVYADAAIHTSEYYIVAVVTVV
jgi:hypothetical protein